MQSVSELLAEVTNIESRLASFAPIADIDDLGNIDTVLQMLNRAERLLLRVEELAGHDGASVEYLNSIRRAILNYLDVQIELGERRAHIMMQKAIADAKRSTLH
ncbi:hypothetical protein [Paraburkholderia megapolitana]|uniref:hypothetical protein n=1 Tax=Paraburkholderia megapolitana TaxID=420953 RepID=UPI0038BE082E